METWWCVSNELTAKLGEIITRGNSAEVIPNVPKSSVTHRPLEVNENLVRHELYAIHARVIIWSWSRWYKTGGTIPSSHIVTKCWSTLHYPRCFVYGATEKSTAGFQTRAALCSRRTWTHGPANYGRMFDFVQSCFASKSNLSCGFRLFPTGRNICYSCVKEGREKNMTSPTNSQSRWRTSRRKTKVAGYASYLSPIWCEDYVWSPGVFIICGRKCFQLDGLFIFSSGLQIWICCDVGVWLRQGRRGDSLSFLKDFETTISEQSEKPSISDLASLEEGGGQKQNTSQV